MVIYMLYIFYIYIYIYLYLFVYLYRRPRAPFARARPLYNSFMNYLEHHSHPAHAPLAVSIPFPVVSRQSLLAACCPWLDPYKRDIIPSDGLNLQGQVSPTGQVDRT